MSRFEGFKDGKRRLCGICGAWKNGHEMALIQAPAKFTYVCIDCAGRITRTFGLKEVTNGVDRKPEPYTDNQPA